MKQFQNILLLHECDQSTLDRAVGLAQQNDARLTILQVLRPLPSLGQLSWSERTLDLQPLARRLGRLHRFQDNGNGIGLHRGDEHDALVRRLEYVEKQRLI